MTRIRSLLFSIPSSLALAAALLFSAGCSSDPDAEDLIYTGCSDNADCEGGRCISGIDSGLCTSNCSSGADCPSGSVCADTEAINGVCLLTCSSGSFCTEHLGSAYTCDTETNLDNDEDVRVCIDAR